MNDKCIAARLVKKLKALLVECIVPQANPRMSEVDDIAKTAGYDVVGHVTQHHNAFDSSFFIGEGKLNEIGKILERDAIEVVIFTQATLSRSSLQNQKEAG